MKRIYLWGTGEMADRILSSLELSFSDYRCNKNFVICGVIDNDSSKYFTYFHELDIVSPGEAIDAGFDDIFVLCTKTDEVWSQIVGGYHICDEKVHPWMDFLKLIYEVKYQDTKEVEFLNTLNYWKDNEISLFNNYISKDTKLVEVIWDKECNLPYIMFPTIEGKFKRMYYPRNYIFEMRDGRQVVHDVLYEQQDGSPHLYINEKHTVKDGDIILDGGVCEGNFSLRFVDLASKIYLVESDVNWREALYYTFKDYEEKVIFCWKSLSDKNTGKKIKVDTLLEGEKLDFLKLDIEGDEPEAVIGAAETLENYNVRSSVCCYHNFGDKNRLQSLFEKKGYSVDFSQGFMTFIWDSKIWETLDFRKGVLYASK